MWSTILKPMRYLAAVLFPLLLSAQQHLAEPMKFDIKTDDRIAALSKQAAAKPSPHAQCLLAKAYIQKMRETVDFGYLERASKIVEEVLTRDGGNYEALQLRSEIGMERHEFASVAEYSNAILKFAPNDPWSWGMLGDASMELGKYDSARDAYTKMVSLRPDLSSYNRLGWYQFVTGHSDSAITLMQSAISSVSEAPENTAWCLADLGGMQFKVGKLAEARASFTEALRVFPGYYPALAGLGRVDMAEHKDATAIANYKRAQAVVPLPDYAAALETLYTRDGKPAEGRKQRDFIDAIDTMAIAAGEKTNRNMALLFADQNRNLPRALTLVESEIKVRPDVYTYDALSWVLFKLKRFDEAAKASAHALVLGTPEPAFYLHAAQIANAQGDVKGAAEYRAKAQALNSKWE